LGFHFYNIYIKELSIMALPRSGQLGISQILAEIRRLQVQTSLDALENGDYAAINRQSRSYPRATNPAAISEWYSYDHSAGGGGGGGGLTQINLGYSGRAEESNFGEIEACSEFSSENVITFFDAEDGEWWTVPIFAERSGAIYQTAGWYSDQPYAGGFTVRYWRGTSWSSAAALCVL
jgi:hypothetical protein